MMHLMNSNFFFLPFAFRSWSDGVEVFGVGANDEEEFRL